jgi:hypothetical protein
MQCDKFYDILFVSSNFNGVLISIVLDLASSEITLNEEWYASNQNPQALKQCPKLRSPKPHENPDVRRDLFSTD